MRKILPIVVLIAVFSLLISLRMRRSSEREGIVIGVSLLNVSYEFIVNIKEAMKIRAEELGVKLIINDAERSAEKQIQQIESFIAQRVDAIILNPCEVEASSPAVDKAIQAKIPIVNVNSETRSVPTAFVGSRDEQSAEIAVSYLAERLKGEGRIVMLSGYPGQAAEIKRSQDRSGAKHLAATHSHRAHLLARDSVRLRPRASHSGPRSLGRRARLAAIARFERHLLVAVHAAKASPTLARLNRPAADLRSALVSEVEDR